MGREWSGDGEEVPEGLWRGAVDRAMYGKRGQKFLRELEQVLLEMQAAGNGRLISGKLVASEEHVQTFPDDTTGMTQAEMRVLRRPVYTVDPTQVCALGAIACKRGVDASVMAMVEADDIWESANFGEQHLDIARVMAWEIATENDHDRWRWEYEDGTEAPKGWEGYPPPRWVRKTETPEQRFDRMLAWVQKHITRGGAP